jgi:hypothetical protein
MKVLQQLFAYFLARGLLSVEQCRRLSKSGYGVAVAPGNLEHYRNRVGESFYFVVTGATAGPLWGTDIYTSDSSVGKAAVHAGLLRPGQAAVLRVTMVPPLAVFPGTPRHGVLSSSWTTGWGGAYRVERV